MTGDAMSRVATTLLFLSLAVGRGVSDRFKHSSHSESLGPQTTNSAEYESGEEVSTEVTSLEKSDETYAQAFPYVEPQPTLSSIARSGRAMSREGRAHVRIIHRWASTPHKKPPMYAKKYRTWKPHKEYIKPVNVKRPKRNRPTKPPYQRRPPHRRNNGLYRPKPLRSNHLQRPTPPPEPDYDYVGEDDFFPEETTKNEYRYKERRPPRKRGNKRKPGYTYSEEKQNELDDNRSISYSNFVQHPVQVSSNFDYTDFIDDEPVQTKHKEKRKKKKKTKDDRKRTTEYNEGSSGQNESSEESSTKNYEKYPPYHTELIPSNTFAETTRQPQYVQRAPIYGDGYLGQQGSYQQNFVNRPVNNVGRYKNDVTPAYSAVNQQYAPVNQFTSPHVRPTPEIITQQNYHQFQNQVPNNVPNFNGHNQQAVNPYMSPINYQQNYISSLNTPSTIGYTSMSNLGNGYSSKYRATSFFDNTDTFQDFNSNVNHQQNKFGAHQGRPNNFIPSRELQQSEMDNEFINRHLDLYSNGMKGIPVQGDGYADGNKETKDFDIGYGEIQYDETHRN